ncbi:MAG: hypothetical protein M1457_00095 [bacterium]|nr:hypothetical protein [bacterium]
MNRTIKLMFAVMVGVVLISVLYSCAFQNLLQIIYILVIAGIGYAVFIFISRILIKHKGISLETVKERINIASGEAWSIKPLLLLIVISLSELCWVFWARLLALFVVGELGYYFFLLILGIALSRWCHAKQYVAIVMPFVLLIIGSLFEAIEFFNDPSAQYRFGPEIKIIVVGQVAGSLSMLPLDAVVTWGSWYISEIIGILSAKSVKA